MTRGRLLGIVLLVLLIAFALVSLRLGGVEATDEIVRQIRAPRMLMAVLVGAGLGMAGALLQGGLGNPLADPALVGVSAGAAVGAAGAAALGIGYHSFALALVATVAAAVAIAIATRAATRDGRPEVVTLLLAGIAVTAFASALLSIIVTLGGQPTRSVTFWTTGSVSLSTWESVWSTAPFIVVGAALAATVARPLDVLSLGDRAAQAAGVAVSRTRWRALIAVTLLVAAGVGVVGVIAFIGLLVPHAVRLLVGPAHGRLLWISAVLGALVLLLADTAARTIAFPTEIPVGAVTALVGAPVFFALLLRTRARQGGWA